MTAQRAGLALIGVFVFVGMFAPWLWPYDPYERVADPFSPPSAAHPLGANDIGQDILSELIAGARVTLAVGVAAGAAAVLVGSVVGLLAAAGPVPLARLAYAATEITLIIPKLPVAIVVAAYLGGGVGALVLVIAAIAWPVTARVVHAQALSLRSREYVLAARSLGAGGWWIARQHLWPGVRGLVWVQFLLAVNTAALTEAGLSFLGLGDPTQKSWGVMLHYAHARSAFLTDAWVWWALPPGLCLTLFLLGLTLAGRSFTGRTMNHAK
ncbi:MAG: ABC transporter permease [Anaerolineae bacterium]|nr:ABC transporter permease [Anaerolineae bacterium]